MKVRLYQELAKDWLQFLAKDTPFSFADMLRESRTNRRVRNAFVVYTVLHETWFKNFMEEAKHDNWTKQLRKDLALALKRLSTEKDSEFSEFGRSYLQRFFMNELRELHPANRYDTSAEIAKFFKTMIRKHRFETNYDSEAERYYQENKHRFNWSVLQ
ncbi:hypothetical protein [Parageobacillus thermoglucosidasius]|uniref:hypothetical protein n=1 Tax=Parageobacillus thermoglucosidasius TaxID=1426 RepID=UPI001FCBD0E9|nr:hypothetical protein [Parageobacillus thermoglucosidasius]BDG34093.1 hypothetical protein PthBH41_38050 [Parageobacillus thermoglucosidasius]GMO01736.1 hypothetical protein PthstB1num2_37770 [Parageobacillus thermoglucosidasius]